MSVKQDVGELLSQFRGPEPLKNLFWSTLEYDRANQPLSTRDWPDSLRNLWTEPPLLLATAGENDDFHVIYTRLAADSLRVSDERPVVTQLLKDHPYALFVFSNRGQDRWHFVNVRYDKLDSRRRVFRRITVGPEERLRTAAERLALLDLALLPPVMFGHAALEIQKRHDDAFDVEVVTRKFYEEYSRIFRVVEQQIAGFEGQADRKRLFTQRLFNRLMFIAFIQKKGWLNIGGQPSDYLYQLWQNYRQAGDGQSFYNERLKLLFFFGLNRAASQDLALAQGNNVVQSLIGQVPYLNGGLFEEDEDDRNEAVTVPDSALEPILLDLFGRFNFTVTESTPLDVEVAVDPEMLGKVFEELVTGRHESGSYYTPKPIVSFMCREALKGYLETALPAEPPAAIARFVDEHEAQELNDPEKALDALKRTRVCDPACGSGAYLLGMLHELLDLRGCLFASRRLDPVSTYQRKLEIIQHNLYGVDIDPFAVNIARLRLWLSLAVEFEGQTPPPLPNLDFKIEAGDSLTAPDPSGGLMTDMFRQQQVERYFALKAEYLREHGERKRLLNHEIEEVRREIAEWAHPKGGATGFDWQVEFAEVFSDGGFDIVVANPPYVRMELFKDIKPVLRRNFPEAHAERADLYCYFYARALQILRPHGLLSFISPNKWLRSGYGANLRKYVSETCYIYSITDFGDLPVFQAATAYPMVFICERGKPKKDFTTYTEVKSLEAPYPDVLAIIQEAGQNLALSYFNGPTWTLATVSAADTLRKMQTGTTTLGEYVKGQICWGVKTGLNEAFIIDGATKAALLESNPQSSRVIKPIVAGKDIGKWRVNHQDKWLLYMYHGVEVNDLPAVIAHLQPFKQQLENRATNQNWYELQQPQMRYASLFEKPKIIYQEISTYQSFAFDTTGAFVNNKVFFLPTDDLYLLGVLNSAYAWQYLSETCTKLSGGALAMQANAVSRLPIPNATPTEKAAIAELAQKCLDAKGAGCEEWEAEINARVARLYGL